MYGNTELDDVLILFLSKIVATVLLSAYELQVLVAVSRAVMKCNFS